MNKRILAAALLCQMGTAANAQISDSVYDGVWSGRFICSEALTAGSRFVNGFDNSISFLVSSKTGVARYDNATDISNWTLKIRNDGGVTVTATGARKEDTGKNWSVDAEGRQNAGKLSAVGAMRSGDGKTIVRAKCEIILQNAQVEARLADAERQKVAAANTRPSVPQETARPTPATTTKRVVTVAPTPAAASGDLPARTAAIAGQVEGTKKGVTKVTSNPVDGMKRTAPNDVWINFNPAITVQERQFCRLIENFRADYRAAEQSRNQIKVNESMKAFSQAINALLPDGSFQGWVMRSLSVAQAKDGSAAIIFELPCGVYVGSNACDANPKNFYGTIPESSRVYSELAKMTVNDFALVSGRFVYADDKAFDKARSVVSYGHLKTAAHCENKLMATTGEFFGVNVNVVSILK